jgi:hypothetical protein
MQPGVFSLSSWDLVGALPISEQSVAERVADGDYRWINRGAVDLMGANPTAERSVFGIERAKSLYGSLPEQLADSNSFVAQLRRMLAARKKYRLAEGELLAVPDVKNKSVCVLLLRVPGPHLGAITALNFSHRDVEERVDLVGQNGLVANRAGAMNGRMFDAVKGEPEGNVPDSGQITIKLPALSAKTLVIERSAP